MFRFLLILLIGQSMANSMKFSEYVDNGRIERVESVIYELLNIIILSDTLNVKEQLLSKLQTVDKERQHFLESRPNQIITPEEIEKLFSIQFKYTDDIQVSLKKDIEDMKHYKILINKLIEQLE